VGYFPVESIMGLTMKDLSSEQRKALVFCVADLFLRDSSLPAEDIAKEVFASREIRITREQVWPLIREAVKLGLLLLAPPRNLLLQQQLMQFPNKGQIVVIDFMNPKSSTEDVRYASAASEHVASAGASLVSDLIRTIVQNSSRPTVHIGLGVGSTTAQFCKHLSGRLSSNPEIKELIIHALTPTYSTNPRHNPLSCFRYFDEVIERVDFVGLHVEPIVPTTDHERIRKTRIPNDAFDRKDEIDIIVTSLASSEDRHGYLRQYIEQISGYGKKLEIEGDPWVGDVQLCPFSKTGPQRCHGLEPSTLFDLEELKLRRNKGKYLVLLCAPCVACGFSKTPALEPILNHPTLHIWTHLVTDKGTAQELVDRKLRMS
jgi:DNA-binding transcriptional regulator LsrR (DeoR family)